MMKNPCQGVFTLQSEFRLSSVSPDFVFVGFSQRALSI